MCAYTLLIDDEQESKNDGSFMTAADDGSFVTAADDVSWADKTQFESSRDFFRLII